MKRAILASLAAMTLAGCMIFEDGFIEDEPDAYFSSPGGN